MSVRKILLSLPLLLLAPLPVLATQSREQARIEFCRRLNQKLQSEGILLSAKATGPGHRTLVNAKIGNSMEAIVANASIFTIVGRDGEAADLWGQLGGEEWCPGDFGCRSLESMQITVVYDVERKQEIAVEQKKVDEDQQETLARNQRAAEVERQAAQKARRAEATTKLAEVERDLQRLEGQEQSGFANVAMTLLAPGLPLAIRLNEPGRGYTQFVIYAAVVAGAVLSIPLDRATAEENKKKQARGESTGNTIPLAPTLGVVAGVAALLYAFDVAGETKDWNARIDREIDQKNGERRTWDIKLRSEVTPEYIGGRLTLAY